MSRVIAGFFLTPLVPSLAFGPLFLIVYPLTLIVTLLIAVPIFLVFRRLGWLNWWHAALVGLTCAVAGLIVDMGGNAVRVEIYGPMHTILFIGMGIVGGLMFWWIALYRNERFPTISRSIPWNMTLLIPIALFSSYYYAKFEPFDVRARLKVPRGPAIPGMVAKSTAQMILPSGLVVTAMVLDDRQIPVAPYVCALVTGRISLTSSSPQYWVTYFLDEHFENHDKC